MYPNIPILPGWECADHVKAIFVALVISATLYSASFARKGRIAEYIREMDDLVANLGPGVGFLRRRWGVAGASEVGHLFERIHLGMLRRFERISSRDTKKSTRKSPYF